MSLDIVTCEPEPAGVTAIDIRACAVPWPFWSAPFARSTARRADGSASVISAVPL